MANTPTVAIADADTLIRQILRLACTARDVEIVGYASSHAELCELAADVEPDVVITSDRLCDEPVDQALARLRALDCRVIVLSADPSPDLLTSLLDTGAFGFFSYDARPEEIANGVLSVGRGLIALNSELLTLIVGQWRRFRTIDLPPDFHRTRRLTAREQDILVAMTDGLSAKAIATRLGVALKTVENHKVRVFEKLGVRSQAHAVTVALAQGLVAAPGGDSIAAP
jgi:DNA-binding NarL/FixJ family response regulator